MTGTIIKSRNEHPAVLLLDKSHITSYHSVVDHGENVVVAFLVMAVTVIVTLEDITT
jgi:hypothetical protein